MASRTRIPPPPVHSADRTVWSNWYVAVKDGINNLRNDLKWINLDFTGSNLTDIETRNHNDLQSINGGSSTERYHLTAAQHTDLTDAGDSTSHYHASDRDSDNFTGTEWTDLTDGGSTTLHSHNLHGVATLNFPSIASNSTAELTMTVTGATAPAAVYLGAPAAIEAGLIWCGYVSAADTVTIRVHNMTGGAINPVSADWHARVEGH